MFLWSWLRRVIHSSWYPHTSALHTGLSCSFRTLHSCTWCHAHSTVRHHTYFASWFANLRLRFLYNVLYNASALKVVATREKSWSAMAESVGMKIRSSYPTLHGDLRATRQTDRQTTKAIGNLQDTSISFPWLNAYYSSIRYQNTEPWRLSTYFTVYIYSMRV